MSQQEFELKRMAGLIADEAHLKAILLQTKPEYRETGLARIEPHLRFKINAGSVIASLPNAVQ